MSVTKIIDYFLKEGLIFAAIVKNNSDVVHTFSG
jgi:hypothetical protein